MTYLKNIIKKLEKKATGLNKAGNYEEEEKILDIVSKIKDYIKGGKSDRGKSKRRL